MSDGLSLLLVLEFDPRRTHQRRSQLVVRHRCYLHSRLQRMQSAVGRHITANDSLPNDDSTARLLRMPHK